MTTQGIHDDALPIFNGIRINLENGDLNNNKYTNETDQRSQSSIPSRISRFSEYPKIRPTNPLYSSQSTLKFHYLNPLPSVPKSSMTLVSRREKFDPHVPRRPIDWQWLSILSIVLFFPIGVLAFLFARKAQSRFRNGFITDGKKLNDYSLVLCILSLLCGITLIMALLFSFDAWPRTNG